MKTTINIDGMSSADELVSALKQASLKHQKEDAVGQSASSVELGVIIVPFSELNSRDDFNSDCGGYGFEWRCPDCKEIVRWAPSLWWRMECSCRSWDLKIEAIGTPNEKLTDFPPNTPDELREALDEIERLRNGYKRLLESSDLEMADGDLAREIATEMLVTQPEKDNTPE